MRLFFALWPGETAAAELEALAAVVARQVDGKPTPKEKIHLTLAFLGEVGEDRVDALRRVGAQARSEPFDLVFDQVGAFRGARVAWVACSRPPPRLMELQSGLESRLRGEGFALDDRPYVPHVTLARKIARLRARAPVAPIRWHAGELALVRSGEGTGRYTTIGRWVLDGKTPATTGGRT